MCFALYSPSIFYSAAVILPKDGDTNLMTMPERMYQKYTRRTPSLPTSSASFDENRVISRIGFVIFKYRLARDCAHFSASYVNL